MSDRPSVSVVVTTIAPRRHLLARALASIGSQTLLPTEIIIAEDTERQGAAVNRQNGLDRVTTEYVAMLDDDDSFLPHHLECLYAAAMETGADLLYPWYHVVGGTDPHAQWEGVPWDNAHPRQTTVTILAKTEVLRAAGGYTATWDLTAATDPGVDSGGNRAGEEYRMTVRVADLGYKIVHVNQRSWIWSHHGENSMGLPSRVNWGA